MRVKLKCNAYYYFSQILFLSVTMTDRKSMTWLIVSPCPDDVGRRHNINHCMECGVNNKHVCQCASLIRPLLSLVRMRSGWEFLSETSIDAWVKRVVLSNGLVEWVCSGGVSLPRLSTQCCVWSRLCHVKTPPYITKKPQIFLDTCMYVTF